MPITVCTNSNDWTPFSVSSIQLKPKTIFLTDFLSTLLPSMSRSPQWPLVTKSFSPTAHDSLSVHTAPLCCTDSTATKTCSRSDQTIGGCSLFSLMIAITWPALRYAHHNHSIQHRYSLSRLSAANQYRHAQKYRGSTDWHKRESKCKECKQYKIATRWYAGESTNKETNKHNCTNPKGKNWNETRNLHTSVHNILHINDSQTQQFITLCYFRATCFDSLESSSGPPLNLTKII
jgi:hypothetical protein